MAFKGSGGASFSYSCDELIEELKLDIQLFGDDVECIVWVEERPLEGVTFYTDYVLYDDIATEDERKELAAAISPDNRIVKMKARELMPLLIKQNEIF